MQVTRPLKLPSHPTGPRCSMWRAPWPRLGSTSTFICLPFIQIFTCHPHKKR